MSEHWTPNTQFAGFGVTAPSADEAARALAERLTTWSEANPGRRLVDVSVQSTAVDGRIELSALITYVEDAGIITVLAAEAAESERTKEIVEKIEAISQAEEIVAEAQQDSP